MMNLVKRCLSVVLLSCLAVAAAAAQARNPEDAAVRKAIEDHYFKAQATGDGSHLKGTFVDEGRMMWVADNKLQTRTSAEYIAGFRGQPPADESQRKRRVLMVDVTGDAAIAKVELDFPDVKFTDYFSMLKIGGDWKIVNKSFHRQPKTKLATEPR
jgi:hypothetical protein